MFSNGTDKAATLFLLQSMFDPVFTHTAHILSKCFGEQGNNLVPYGYTCRTLGASSTRLLPANHIQKPPVHEAQASMRCPTALNPKALSHERKDLHNHEVGQLDQEQQGFDEVTLESMLLKPHIICSVSGNTIRPIVRTCNPFKVDGRVETAQSAWTAPAIMSSSTVLLRPLIRDIRAATLSTNHRPCLPLKASAIDASPIKTMQSSSCEIFVDWLSQMSKRASSTCITNAWRWRSGVTTRAPADPIQRRMPPRFFGPEMGPATTTSSASAPRVPSPSRSKTGSPLSDPPPSWEHIAVPGWH